MLRWRLVCFSPAEW